MLNHQNIPAFSNGLVVVFEIGMSSILVVPKKLMHLVYKVEVFGINVSAL